MTTFSFFETAISCSTPGRCELSASPVATLTVPGPTSVGSASWPLGNPILPGDPPPTLTGDALVAFAADSVSFHINTANPYGAQGGPGLVRNYDIRWNATDGILNQIRFDFLTVGDEALLGPSGGRISSDFQIGGCLMTQCLVTGFWTSQQAVAVSEPATAAMLGVALLAGTAAARMRQRAVR